MRRILSMVLVSLGVLILPAIASALITPIVGCAGATTASSTLYAFWGALVPNATTESAACAGAGGTYTTLAATSTILYAVLPISYYHTLSSSETFSIVLMDNSDTNLDCSSPTESFAAAGMVADNNPSAPGAQILVGPFSGTQCAINPGMSYAIGDETSGVRADITLNGQSPQAYWNYALYSTNPDFVDTTTRIISTVPAPGSTVATSSSATVGVDVYVNPSDYQSGEYVQMSYAPYSAYQAAVADPSLLFKTIDFPITADGESDFSTTSPITTPGLYSMQTTIYSVNKFDFFNIFSFNLSQTALVSTSTQFTAGALTGYDIFVASTTASINDYLASSTVSLASCTSFTSFNLGDCLNLIFIPQAAPIESALQSFQQGFLSYAPWGYITRFVAILSGEGEATSSLPILSASFPLGQPGTSGYIADATFTIDPNTFVPDGADMMSNVQATFGPGEGETFRQIIEPILRDIFAMMLVMAIIFDVVRFRGNPKHGGRKGGKLS